MPTRKASRIAGALAPLAVCEMVQSDSRGEQAAAVKHKMPMQN